MHEVTEQKAYETPRVLDYGTLVDITRAGSQTNADVPKGNNNACLPAPSSVC